MTPPHLEDAGRVNKADIHDHASFGLMEGEAASERETEANAGPGPMRESRANRKRFYRLVLFVSTYRQMTLRSPRRAGIRAAL